MVAVLHTLQQAITHIAWMVRERYKGSIEAMDCMANCIKDRGDYKDPKLVFSNLMIDSQPVVHTSMENYHFLYHK